ncbi:MAG TPA: rhomboid family intramembrane serine protease [Pyrinomonadaceae bacterium]|nr:rhomboid family intramembrane serine protease [Pyrinomonadaceae bacterium]
MQTADLTNRRPWEVEAGFEEKPDTLASYGYVSKGNELHPCSLPLLVERCAEGGFWGSPPVLLVWTPETSRLVVPEEIPYLHDALRLRERKVAKSTIGWCLFFLALILTPLFLFADSGKLIRLVLIFYALPLVVGVGASIHTLRKKIEYTRESINESVTASRYEAWLETQRLTYTKWLCGCFIALMVFELPGETEAIEAAGLVKPAVWRGEVWRLLTCSMLHVNFMHFWMNALALLSLGRVVEVHASRWHLPIVFLFSVLTGSVFSLLLLPNATSAGASGGLMGLVGMLLVLGYRRRAYLPPQFLKEMLLNIGLIGLIGVVGYDIIDNAAHLGGLIGGILAGLWLVRGNEDALDLAPTKRLTYAGDIALILILLTAAGAAFAIVARYLK